MRVEGPSPFAVSDPGVVQKVLLPLFRELMREPHQPLEQTGPLVYTPRFSFGPQTRRHSVVVESAWLQSWPHALDLHEVMPVPARRIYIRSARTGESASGSRWSERWWAVSCTSYQLNLGIFFQCVVRAGDAFKRDNIEITA